ncbi:hypothetical protein M1L60_16940 [Actinoplanes sp. TRM 88003]|uniref:Co-chaperone DjlA N-terminal domain-containing protein n=1 Tax=Paractinoplanes aksuensis TaxID=2939490 RepID=A0ABT1DN75_9ACTN|nr:hypothetical protein [Actinoplanes aksuensis]MCO8272281.1 hypothetical protein [Actinoplanes aksuensis]
MSPIFSPASGVRTAAGHYLQLVAREEAPQDCDAPDEDARRLWEIAFGLAARRRFTPDSSLAEIRRTVAGGLPTLEAEMLLRAALGEKVPVDEIDLSVRTGAHLLLFARLADEMALTDGELEGLVARAEELAAEPEVSPRPELTDAP